MKLDSDTIIATLADFFQEQYGVRCERNKTYPWLKHDGRAVVAAAYFAAPLNCLFAFDADDRLNAARLRTLEKYPSDAPLGFDFRLYTKLCAASRKNADARIRRQANQDAVLDLLPPKHGLNPTVRLAEAELRQRIIGKPTEQKLRSALTSLLEKRIGLHAGTTFQQLLDHPSGKPFIPRLGMR